MKITHINNKAIAARVILLNQAGSEDEIQSAYTALQKRYGLTSRVLKPSRVTAIQSVMASEHFAYLMKIITDEKKASG